MRFFIYSLIFLFYTQVGQAQKHFALSDFRVFSSQKTVVLNWTIKEGNTCNGVGIFRAEGEGEFEEIGIIGGVCGSLDVPISYTFIDSFPINNKSVKYRLQLGLLGNSQAISHTYYQITDNIAIVIPNPIKNSTKIIFDNPNGEKVQLSIFNNIGQKISYSDETNGNIFFFDLTKSSLDFLPNSSYFFYITNNQGKIISKGSFILTK